MPTKMVKIFIKVNIIKKLKIKNKTNQKLANKFKTSQKSSKNYNAPNFVSAHIGTSNFRLLFNNQIKKRDSLIKNKGRMSRIMTVLMIGDVISKLKKK